MIDGPDKYETQSTISKWLFMGKVWVCSKNPKPKNERISLGFRLICSSQSRQLKNNTNHSLYPRETNIVLIL